MANTNEPTTRPDIMDSLTESQLKELELRFDDDDRSEFNSLAATYDWPQDVIDNVWNWLASGRRREGFEG